MKMFDAGKTIMIGLSYGEKNYDVMLSRFYLIPERYGRTDRQTDGQTDRQTYRFAISISRVSMLTRDKNGPIYLLRQYATARTRKLVVIAVSHMFRIIRLIFGDETAD